MKVSSILEDILPLTPIQEFFLDGGSCSTPVNILLYGYRLEGDLDPLQAQKNWQDIVDTFPSLRTSLHVLEPGRAFQAIHRHAALPWYYEDLSLLPPVEKEEKIYEYQRHAAGTLFDWLSPPLLKVALHKLGDREWMMTVVMDHMIFDGWSLGLAMNAFLSACSGMGPTNIHPAPSIASFSLWQKSQDHAAAMDWFAKYLDNIPDQKLPFASQAPWPSEIMAEDMIFLRLTDKEEERITNGAKKLGITTYTLFQGAWALILSRCQEEKSAYFLSSVAVRPSSVPGIEQIFGLLLGVIPICLRCQDGVKCASWLEELRTYQVESMDYNYASPGELASFQKKTRPGAQISCMVFQNMDTGEREATTDANMLRIAGGGTISRSGYALVVGGLPHQGLTLSFMYDKRIFSKQGVEKLATLFRQTMLSLSNCADATLEQLCNAPELAPLLDEACRTVSLPHSAIKEFRNEALIGEAH